ncbi:MAG: hypothetical protein C5B59_15955 [Bacteroidetes bacterium]|nr:MAG: hypothetical protein C5B59_15955 [Bacteroidota bacterium]
MSQLGSAWSKIAGIWVKGEAGLDYSLIAVAFGLTLAKWKIPRASAVVANRQNSKLHSGSNRSF